MIYLDNNTQEQVIYIPRMGLVPDNSHSGNALQSKSYKITENGRTLITPDQGFVGVSAGTIDVEVESENSVNVYGFPNTISLDDPRNFDITIKTDAYYWSLSQNNSLSGVTFNGSSGITGSNGTTIVTVDCPETLTVKSSDRYSGAGGRFPVFTGSTGYRDSTMFLNSSYSGESMGQTSYLSLYKHIEYNYVCSFKYTSEDYDLIGFAYNRIPSIDGEWRIKVEGDITMLKRPYVSFTLEPITSNEWETLVGSYVHNEEIEGVVHSRLNLILKTASTQQAQGTITIEYDGEVVDVITLLANY